MQNTLHKVKSNSLKNDETISDELISNSVSKIINDLDITFVDVKASDFKNDWMKFTSPFGVGMLNKISL